MARLLCISRPLLYMHLQKLEAAELIMGQLELSDDGKAMKYYAVADFHISLTPSLLRSIADQPR
jgi:ArsR family transcriptional regulator